MEKPELLVPVGNFEMLQVAVDSGADAIYFGVAGLNMRASAKNFKITDIKAVLDLCHENDVKAYLCINTIIFEDEIVLVKKILSSAKKIGVDAIICWDQSVISIARKMDFEIHLSTQASVSNSVSAKEYKKLGISRIVLARECTLKNIKEIRKNVDVEVETFVHGAMCVAISGRCFMSENLYGKSANRGECIQPCRRSYDVTDPETSKELEMFNNYVMSPKDLCTIQIFDKLIDAKIDCFKIEGRNRSPEYLKVTIECYKKAIELYFKKKLTKKKKNELFEKLKTVYNRGFSTGFFLGKPIDAWTDAYGSKSTMVKEYVGKVLNYYGEVNVAEVKLETGNLQLNEDIMIIGPTTGCQNLVVESLQIERKNVKNVFKGQSVGLKVVEKVRKNDKIYRWMKRK